MPNIYRSVKVPKNEIDTVLSITSQPTKTVYQPDEPLDITGLTIIADINGMQCDVTNSCSYSPSLLTNTGVNTITAMYSGYTTTFEVIVEGYVGITITTPPSRIDYRVGNTLSLSGMVITADYGTYTEVVSSGDYTTVPASGDTLTMEDNTLTISYNGKSVSTQINVYGTLEETSWERIREVASRGKASNVWSIGDRKSVTLNGRVGDYLTFNNDTSLYVFIMHFNYRSQNGILFGCFQEYDTANSEWKDVTIVDSKNNSNVTNGTKAFNYYHWTTNNGYVFGGWKGCDLRYDILGSTNIPPSGYGSAPAYGRVGYDATETCATNPVPNTLMAALPADLRACMAPLTIYTSNQSDSLYPYRMNNTAEVVTASIDYLPVLSEYEFLGANSYANEYEKNYQTRPSYYSSGFKLTYKHNALTAVWNPRTRSPRTGNEAGKCIYYIVGVTTQGTSTAAFSTSVSAGQQAVFRIG